MDLKPPESGLLQLIQEQKQFAGLLNIYIELIYVTFVKL